MSAYGKQQRVKKDLGVASVQRVSIDGNTATWHVIMSSGFKHILDVNRMCTETGVLTTLKARLEAR
jgi:hypothetical protein